jgi:hypothetical protein
LLPEWPAPGNVAHQKRRYALRAAILISRVLLLVPLPSGEL